MKKPILIILLSGFIIFSLCSCSQDKKESTYNITTIASAIIDRLVHHSVIINIKGKSYRIKDLVQEEFENQKVAN